MCTMQKQYLIGVSLDIPKINASYRGQLPVPVSIILGFSIFTLVHHHLSVLKRKVVFFSFLEKSCALPH